MERKQLSASTKLILGSLSGMVLGIVIFIITENFIFLIVFSTIGLTMGIALSTPDQNREDTKE